MNMKVSQLFDVYSGSKLDYEKQEHSEEGILFISRNSNNNGVVGRVIIDEEKVRVFKKGDITVPLGGEYLLSAFIQDEDFVTAQNVAVLRPKKEMKEIEKLFYCYVLRENRFKFCAFGREVNKYLEDIELPNEIPNWVYEANINKIATTIIKNQTLEIDITKWKLFKYNKIFIIKNGFYNKKPEHTIEGNIPFLGAIDNNNGVTEYYSVEDIKISSKTGKDKNAPLSEKIFSPNAICVTNNGSVGYAYWQENNFTCSHDINILYKKDGEFNKYTAMFIITVIEYERYRWTYGRKWRTSRMENSKIKLPILLNNDGTPFVDKTLKYSDEGFIPDWDFMEKYIKLLPYSDKL